MFKKLFICFFILIHVSSCNEDNKATSEKSLKATEQLSLDNSYSDEPNEHLKEIAWLIGKWVDQDKNVDIQTENAWNTSKNLILGKFSVVTEGKKELEGSQIFAWDPEKQQIRSWIFDSDGAFGESSWKKEDKRWVVDTVQTLADGRKASVTYIFTPIDSDSYTWEAVNRDIDGTLLPDVKPVTIKRVKT